MPDFNLPAGCRMRFTASMEKHAHERHRWSVTLHTSGDGPGADPRAQYGSQIARGETQRIDAPAIASDCICRVEAMTETESGWQADIASVTVATTSDVTMEFCHPGHVGASDGAEKFVLAFELSPLAG